MDAKKVLGMCLRPAMAAAVAMPMVCLAADETPGAAGQDANRAGVDRAGVGAQSGQTKTVEGRLITLHEFMVGGSAAATPGQARAGQAQAGAAGRGAASLTASGPWVLQTGTDAIILSDLNAQRLGAAGAGVQPGERGAGIEQPDAEVSSDRDVLDRDDDVAGVDRPAPRPGESDGSADNLPIAGAPDESEGRVLGIPRADLDRANQRVKATGTLYTRAGMKYMVVTNISAVTGADAGGTTGVDRDRGGADDQSRPGTDLRNRNRGQENAPGLRNEGAGADRTGGADQR